MNVYLNLCRYKILQKECHYHFYLNFFDQNQKAPFTHAHLITVELKFIPV